MHAYYRNLCKISDLSIYRTINDKEHTFMAGKAEKTNVMRILDKAEIPYQTHFYSPDTGIDAVSVANALGQDPQAVFKTLVTQGKSRAFYVFVIPATGSLNLKRAAAACGEKAVEMIPQKALLPNTGYIHGGCSPIGMKKTFPTFVDSAAQHLERVSVSAGVRGCQVILAVDALVACTKAKFADLCRG